MLRSAKITVLLALVASLGLAHAHVPEFPGENEGLDEASPILDPAKSWAVYGELHEAGEAQYYRMELEAGDRIRLSLLVSSDPTDAGFRPDFALMGPGIAPSGEVPEFVEVPESYTVTVVRGERPPEASYEGFSPSSFFAMGDLDVDAPETGTYYVAVYAIDVGGKYSLVVGYVESFTLQEWILVPINLVAVYRWEGQGLASILGPMLATVVVGVFVALWLRGRHERRMPLRDWIGTFAALTFVGSGVTIIYQMFFTLSRAPMTADVAITVVFAALPLLLGVGLLRITLGSGISERVSRVKTIALGVLGLFLWAGLIVGPVVAVVASLLPGREPHRTQGTGGL